MKPHGQGTSCFRFQLCQWVLISDTQTAAHCYLERQSGKLLKYVMRDILERFYVR